MKKLIKNCRYVLGRVRTGEGDGCYLEIKKCSILHNMKETPHEFDINQFQMIKSDLYIN